MTPHAPVAWACPFVAAVFLAIVLGVGPLTSGQTETCLGLRATKVGTRAAETLVGTEGRDVIVAKEGNDVIRGLGGDDVVCAGSGNDTIFGEQGDDRLLGQADSDFLFGGPGNDRLDGGGGVGPSTIDLAAFDDAPGPVQVNLAQGRASGEGSDVIVGIDSISGSNFDDALVGDGDINFISGNRGDDVVDGGGGDDSVLFYYAGVTASLQGGTASGEGSDRLANLEGLIGSRYADVLTGDGARNYVAGGGGDDLVEGGAGDDRVYGEAGIDRVSGGEGNDLISGNAGDDVLDGGEGVVDSLSFVSSPRPVDVNLESGVATGDGVDSVVGVEAVSGSPFADTLSGDAAANALFGYLGNDRIAGGAGPDFLGGGSGRNSLNDGAGSDYCLEGSGAARCEITGLPGAIPGSPGRPPRSPSGQSLEGSDADAAPLAVFRAVLTNRQAEAISHSSNVRKAALRSLGFAPKARTDGPEVTLRRFLDPANLFGVLTGVATRDRFQYAGEPACLSSTAPFRTSIAPPVRVEPTPGGARTQHAWWRGILFRQKPGGRRWAKVRATPWATAQIAGGATATGLPNWLDAKRRRFISRFAVTVGPGRYAWGAELHWDPGRQSFYGFVEPHVVYKPAVAHKKYCDFRR